MFIFLIALWSKFFEGFYFTILLLFYHSFFVVISLSLFTDFISRVSSSSLTCHIKSTWSSLIETLAIIWRNPAPILLLIQSLMFRNHYFYFLTIPLRPSIFPLITSHNIVCFVLRMSLLCLRYAIFRLLLVLTYYFKNVSAYLLFFLFSVHIIDF